MRRRECPTYPAPSASALNSGRRPKRSSISASLTGAVRTTLATSSPRRSSMLRSGPAGEMCDSLIAGDLVVRVELAWRRHDPEPYIPAYGWTEAKVAEIDWEDGTAVDAQGRRRPLLVREFELVRLWPSKQPGSEPTHKPYPARGSKPSGTLTTAEHVKTAELPAGRSLSASRPPGKVVAGGMTPTASYSDV
jgi:hypothetical protein